MNIIDQIRGLDKNIAYFQKELDEMCSQAYDACCPSCYWGSGLAEVEEKIERRAYYRRVLLCRLRGFKPRKVRAVKVKADCCSGKTTMFSVGRCDCMEPNCPGRGICHVCRGTGKKWGVRKVQTRPWPPTIEVIEKRGVMLSDEYAYHILETVRLENVEQMSICET